MEEQGPDEASCPIAPPTQRSCARRGDTARHGTDSTPLAREMWLEERAACSRFQTKGENKGERPVSRRCPT